MFVSFVLVPALYGVIAGFVAFFVSPLQYMKVMRQQTGKAYSEILVQTFANSHPLKLFFGGAVPYVVMNFLSNLSYGVSDGISDVLKLSSFALVFSAVLKAMIGGFIETIFTVYPELKEVIRNKGPLASVDAMISSIIVPSMLRNSVVWLGVTFSCEITARYAFSQLNALVLSTLLGLIFGVLSIPFDVIVTRNSGSFDKLGFIGRFLEMCRSSKGAFVLGSAIRVIQIVIFTVVTVCTVFLVKFLGL